MKFRPLVFTLFILICPLYAFAQGGQQGADNSLLPEINPQDIEIRSEFKARFPGLRRQPILGFNPKPRVFQIDPNRMPFMESRDDAVADISVTQLGRPEPPARTILSTPERINAYVRAGLGSYLTPELAGYGFYRFDDKSYLTADLNYRSSDGHLDNQSSSFRYFDASAKYVNQLSDELKVMVNYGILNDFNHLFNLDGTIQDTFIGPTAEKNYSGFNGEIALQKKKNTLTGWDASIGGNMLQMNMAGLTTDANESGLYSSFSYYWPGKRIYETFDISADIQYGYYDPDYADFREWVIAQSSVEYERLLNFNTRISGTAGFAYVSDPVSQKVYFTPEIEVKHNFTDELSVTGNAFARPQMPTLQELHQQNRFLNMNAELQHAYHLGVAAEVNLSLFEGNKLFGGLQYSHVKDYAFYQRRFYAGPYLGFYEVNYSDASLFEIYAGASQQLVPEKFWFDAKVYARSPKLTNGNMIPYEEKLGIKGAISYKVIKELTINSWAEYIGSRKAPVANSTLGAYVLLNAGAEYEINQTFGVYARMLNILGQKYEIWDGYTERPFQVFGGLTIKF